MASDRAIIVRIAGIGFEADKAYPLTLTSVNVGYLQGTALQGVVTDLSAQFSSEIPIFSAMGSDPTTTFSVLSTTDTLSALMSRGATQVRDLNEASIQTTAYVTPSPAPTIALTDTSTIGFGDIVRINGIAYYVNASSSSTPGTIDCLMAYGSVPQPIPIRVIGEQPSGSTVYASYWQGTNYPTGGAEQQPVTISTVEIDAPDATHETVIFRGVVSRANIQTSSGADNQIRVECMSLMGVIRNAPWAPSTSGLRFEGTPGFNEERFYEADDDRLLPPNSNFSGVLKTVPNTSLTGPIFEATSVPYDTRFATMQIRTGGYGGVTSIIGVSGNEITLSARPVDPDLDDIRAVGFNLMFNDGYYRQYSSANGDDLNVALSASSLRAIRNARARFSTSPTSLNFDSAFVTEIALSSASFQSLIVDLIFGTYNADLTGASGVRAWGMSAWIPFDITSAPDIIDYGSLNAAFNTEQMQTDLPLMNGWDPMTSTQLPNTVVLPVKAEGPKTIGEVLESLMKNLGVFMVYDRGRISFGRWASENPWPTVVNDSDFAEPKIALTYDRNNSIQAVSVEYPATITADEVNITKNPIANVERIINGAGKMVTVGSMMQQGDDYQAGLINSFAFRNGTDLVTRYSQAAGIIEVTLRNETIDLAVGEYVSFSSAFIPNGSGTMGVVNATGIVLKAVRSYLTPTSSYTLFLPGYLFAANRVSMLSASARVETVPSSGTVAIEQNAFTDLNSQLNAPKSDPEAFQQVLDRCVTVPVNIKCALYDQYGTPYGITARLTSVSGTSLVFSSANFDTAIAGDIIVLDFASNQDPLNLAASWDAFQADNLGLVVGDPAYSYPWSR